MTTKTLTQDQKNRKLKKIAALRKTQRNLREAEAALDFPDPLIDSELEDIDEEIWELEQNLAP